MRSIVMNNVNDSIPTASEQRSPSKLSVDFELIKILYQQAHTALIGVIATATGVSVIYFFNDIPKLTVTIWLMTIYILSFIRYLSIKKFKRLNKDVTDNSRWGMVFTFFTFLSGITWGAASIIFYTPESLQLFSILTLIIIAMSVGSLAALSSFPKSYYFFIIPTMLPIIWRYLTVDEQYYIIFGLLLFVFNFALLKIVRVNNKILRNSIILRLENIGLISQLTEQKEKAEYANLAKTKFLAAASHDIRQPLHAMGLFLGVLEERVEKDDQRLIVHKIQKSTSSLNDLLDSLLDISKLDAGIIQVKKQAFSIKSLFKVLDNEFKPNASEKNLKLHFINSEIWINSDYLILERIARNLISNAIRYTNNGGVVVGCRRSHGDIILAVYDSGIGIAKESLQEIFMEFHQLHNLERDRSNGLGLGLAIVKRMTELLEMSLFVKSVPGRGSVFGIVIPSNMITSTRVLRKVKDTCVNNFEGKCILVIDDEEEIRDSLSELLKGWKCKVMASSSGSEAVKLLNESNIRPDLILADYRLRDNETGIDVIKKINALSFTPAIPAIVITGDTAPDRIKEAELGGYKVLHKPVSPNKLRSLLTEEIYLNK